MNPYITTTWVLFLLAYVHSASSVLALQTASNHSEKHWQQTSKCVRGLLREHTVPERGELLPYGEFVAWVCDPAFGEPHQPFHEYRRGSRLCCFIQSRGGWRRATGDLCPASHCFGVSPPALKSSPIRFHKLSGSSLRGCPFGPWSARSMIW